MRSLRVLSALLLVPAAAHAGTVRVGPGQTYTALGPAVAAAQAGDTVLVDPGTYTLAGTVSVGKALTIRGNGGKPVLQGTDLDLLQVTTGAVTLQDLVLRPTGGRGVHVKGGTVSVLGVEITGNTKAGNEDGAGMLVSAAATVLIDDSWFHDNTARKGGTPSRGGCLAVRAGSVTVRDTTFERCLGNQGGGIDATGGTLVVDHVTFSQNEAGEPYDGGGLRIGPGADATVTNSTFLNNTAFERGGGLYAEGALTLRTSRFEGNVAGRITSLVNIVDAGGGATIYCDASPCPRAIVEDNAFVRNTALATGGGLYLRTPGPSRVVRNLFCGNDSSGDAGALYVTTVATSFTVLGNVFVGNDASGQGGAIWCNDGATGGVVQNNTFLGNDASTGSAVSTPSCAMSFRNNLLMDNGSGNGEAAYDGTGGTFDYNGWFRNGTNSTRTLGRNDLTGVDPKLVAWSDDGDCGNDDYALATGSPAIDRGDPAILDRNGSRSDLGATGGPESLLLVDDDGDGFAAGQDCDDSNPAVAPGRPELCNGVDEDCDGQVDFPAPASAPVFYQDADGDGHGTAAATLRACSQPAGWSTLADDCNDANPGVFPGATELCDGFDNDCDALTDGADAADLPAWYPDRDGDGHGRGVADPERGCTGSPGTVALGDDCDDGSALIAPGMPETCDGVDQDCDGQVDDDPVSALTFYKDADGDGWGDPDGRTRQACRVPDGFAIMVGDCDDVDPDIHPTAPEPCDPPRDLNCDGAFGTEDRDSDGFPACQDCDDFDSSAKPGAVDPWYDGRIQDCARTSDYDQDGDGHDVATAGGDDCDDQAAQVHPGVEDVGGDGLDANCDGVDGVGGGTDDGDDTDGDDGGSKVACEGCASPGSPAGAPVLGLMVALIGLRRRRA